MSGRKKATKRTHEHKRKVKRRPPAARVSQRDPACLHDRKCSVVQGVRGLFWCPSCGSLHYDSRWHRPAK